MLLESLSKQGDRLSLFDPEARVDPPLPAYQLCVDIVGEEHVYGDRAPAYDLINLSYVLCFLEPEDAKVVLENLRMRHPCALFTIVDYVLAGRSQMEVLSLLSAGEECRWRERMGVEGFCRAHTRFSLSSLLSLTQDSGMQVLNGQGEYLDSKNLRAAILCQPAVEEQLIREQVSSPALREATFVMA